MNTTPQYDDSYKKLIATLKTELDQSRTKYSLEHWEEFAAALYGILRAFEDLRKKAFQEQKSKVEKKELQDKAKKAHNKIVEAEVAKVHKFIQFIEENDFKSDPKNKLFCSVGFHAAHRSSEDESLDDFVKDLKERLKTFAKVLGYKKIYAFRSSTLVLRRHLLKALACISNHYLQIEPKKSSDLKGFNVIATRSLIYVTEIETDLGNFYEQYAHAIDDYLAEQVEITELLLDYFGKSHLNGYQAFIDYVEESVT